MRAIENLHLMISFKEAVHASLSEVEQESEHAQDIISRYVLSFFLCFEKSEVAKKIEYYTSYFLKQQGENRISLDKIVPLKAPKVVASTVVKQPQITKVLEKPIQIVYTEKERLSDNLIAAVKTIIKPTEFAKEELDEVVAAYVSKMMSILDDPKVIQGYINYFRYVSSTDTRYLLSTLPEIKKPKAYKNFEIDFSQDGTEIPEEKKARATA